MCCLLDLELVRLVETREDFSILECTRTGFSFAYSSSRILKYVCTHAFLHLQKYIQINRKTYSRYVPDVYTGRHAGVLTEVHLYGGSILSTENLCKIFRQISEV